MAPHKIPPSFVHIGEEARDILNAGYLFGLWRLNVKMPLNYGIKLEANGTANHVSQVNGFLESKCRWENFSICGKWNTDHILSSRFTFDNKLLNGLHFAFDASFTPQSGNISGRVKTSYVHEKIHFKADSTIDYAPLINASAVVSFDRWCTGYRFQYNASKSMITGNEFALAYKSGGYVFYGFSSDIVYGCSIYRKFKSNLESAADFKWTPQETKLEFGIGCKYDFDRNGSLYAKVNNLGEIGLGFKQKLCEGITLNLSTQIDGKNISDENKIGVSVEIDGNVKLL